MSMTKLWRVLAVLPVIFSRPGYCFEGEPKVESFILRAQVLFGNPKIIEHNGVSFRLPGLYEAPGDREMSDEVKLSPAQNRKREEVVRELFLQAGAKPDEISIQDLGNDRHNIMVIKPGETDRALVIGGHHDKVSVGQGTVDNWAGATMVTNLYQAFQGVSTRHALVFIAFGREEEGLLGSKHYVSSLDHGRLSKIDAMINLDTLAVDGTFSWKNNGDAKMLSFFRDTAEKTKLQLEEKILFGGDADSSSFRRAGIQAMTLFGASPSVIFDIIHSEKDSFAAFSLAHYKNSYLLTRAVVERLDKGWGRTQSQQDEAVRRVRQSLRGAQEELGSPR